MKNRIVKFIKKQGLLVWIIIAAVILTSIGALAMYDSTTNTMKRVVVSDSSQGKMFSSNVLVEDGAGAYVPRYFTQLTDTTSFYPVDIYLWNYSLTNPAKWYSDTINYNITFELTDSNGTTLTAAALAGGKTIIIADKDGNELATLNGTTPVLSYNTTGSLTYSGSQSSENKFTLKYSGNWNLDNDLEVCVKVVATPNNGGNATKYQDISPLGAIIGLKRSVSEESTGWQAYIDEQYNNMPVGNCDAYNMVVSGAGKATITVKWDTRYLGGNKNFYLGTLYNFGTYADNTKEVEYHAPETGSYIATLIIHADTASSVTENRNRYDIQFYKTGKKDPATWGFVTRDENSLGDDVWLYINVKQED